MHTAPSDQVEAPLAATSRTRSLFAALVVILFAAVLLNLSLGAVSVAPAKTLAILADAIGIDLGTDFTDQQEAVVRSIRLPRIILGALVGAGLGVAGGALQGVFRNPLADPQLIGVSSGAALGAVIVVIIAGGALGSLAAPAGGFIGGLLAAIVVYSVARYQGRTEVVTLVLTGIAVNALAIAAVGFLTFTVDNDQLRTVTFWTLGSLAVSTWKTVGITLPLVAAGVLLLPAYARPLNLLLLGEGEARHSGVNVEQTRLAVMALGAITVGAAVAAAGVIGFVGLLAPHAIRLAAGPDHRIVLPASAIAGAALVLFADLVGRTAASPTEIPVGLLTALVGGPFFLWLLRRTRREEGGWG